MNFFDSVYTKVFGKNTSAPILINEVIKRSQRFMDHFQVWKSSGICQDLLNDVWQSYFWKKKGIDKNPHLYILNSNYSNGIAIDYESKYDTKSFHFLFEYLAERVKKLDYRLVMSRCTTKENSENVETKELHYLKPKRQFVEPIDQQYGNIQIEYKMIDDLPSSIRLIAKGYPDRKYKEVKDFDELAEHIFNLEF